MKWYIERAFENTFSVTPGVKPVGATLMMDLSAGKCICYFITLAYKIIIFTFRISMVLGRSKLHVPGLQLPIINTDIPPEFLKVEHVIKSQVKGVV